MKRSIRNLLSVFMILILCMSSVYAYTGDQNGNTGNKEKTISKDANQKKLFKTSNSKKDKSIKSKGEALDRGKDTNQKSKTIVLKLKDIKDVKKLNITEEISSTYSNIDTITLEIPEGADPDKILAKYKKNSVVEEVYVDSVATLFYTPTDPYYETSQWNLKMINMESAWDSSKGDSSVVVAVIDTGYGPYQDVDGVLNGVDVSGSTILEDTYPGQYSYEGNEHGTAIASLIASEMNSVGIAGISPNVSLMPVKIFADGELYTGSTQIAAGIRWAADHGADLINLSLGSDYGSTAEEEAIEYALNKDVMIIAASGNDAYTDWVSYPAAYDGVIAVGSTGQTDYVSNFSNEGYDLDLVAPGESITLPYLPNGANAYLNYSGTSFSAPTVCAIAALVKSKHPNYSSNSIEQILYAGTDDIGLTGWDSSSGYGRINAEKVMSLAANDSLFDGNDSISSADKIYANKEYKGKTSPVNDKDYYKFTLLESYSLAIKATSSSEIQDLVLELYNSGGNLLAKIDDKYGGAGETLTYDLSAGTYYVNAYDWWGDVYEEEYTLNIQLNDTTPPVFLASTNGSPVQNGGTSPLDVNVQVKDTSYQNVLVTKDGQNYNWPQDGLFTEQGSYNITSTDSKGNFSSFSFTILRDMKFMVAFDSLGGTHTNSLEVLYNTMVVKPTNPTRSGYIFIGWYKEASCINAWNFASDIVTMNTTIYAKWEANPAAPTNVKGISVNSTTVNLSWDAVPGASGYDIYQSTSTTGSYSKVGSTTTLSLNNTGLSAGKTYYYRVVAYKSVEGSNVYGDYSSVISAKPIPVTPASVKTTFVNSTTIKLSWSAVTGVSGYEIYRATSSTGSYSLLKSTGSTYYSNTGLSSKNTYYYKVRSYVTVGSTKVYSGFSVGIPAKTIPFTPTSAKAYSNSYNSIKTTWGAVSGISGYEVYRATSSTGSYSKVATTTALSYTNSGLTTAKTYYYKVRAYKTIGSTKLYGNYSSTVSAKPVPSIPSNTKAVLATYNSIKMSWSGVSGASSYQVYRATSSTGTYSLIKTTTSTSYTNTGLSTNKTYYYKVRAYRTVGSTKIYGSYSSVVSAATRSQLAPSYSIYSSAETDSYTAIVGFSLTNSGTLPMRVYSEGYLIDDDYYSFDRTLHLVDAYTGIDISSIEIPAGATRYVFYRVIGNPTWYDQYTTIEFEFTYDSSSYQGSASSYYDNIYWEK